MKNTVYEMKNILMFLTADQMICEKEINELEDREVETIQNETEGKKTENIKRTAVSYGIISKDM